MAATYDVTLRLLIEAVDKTGKVLQDVAANLDTVTKHAAGTGIQTKKAGEQGKEGAESFKEGLSGIEERLNAINDAGTRFIKTGAGIAGAGIGIIAVAGVFAKAASDFKEAFDEIRLGSSGSKEQIAELRDLILDLSVKTEFSASKIAKAVDELEDSGMKPAEILKNMASVTNLATVAQTDLVSAAKQTMLVLQSTGLPMERFNDVVDIMAVTSMSTTKNLDELSNSVSRIAPYARATNVSIEQLTAMLTVLGEKGIGKVNELRTVMSAFEDGGTARKVLAEMQIEVAKTGEGAVDFFETMNRLKEKMGTDLSGWSSILKEMFGGQQGFAVAKVVLENQAEILGRVKDEFTDYKGVAKEVSTDLRNNLTPALKETMSAIYGAGVALGESLVPAATSVVQKIRDLVIAIRDFLREHPAFAAATTGIIASIGGIAFIIGGALIAIGLLTKAALVLSGMIGTAIIALTGFVGWIRAIPAAAGAARTSILLLAGATTTAGIAARGMIAAFAAFGVIEIVRAVVEIWKLYQSLKEAEKAEERAAQSAEKLKQKFAEMSKTLGYTVTSNNDLQKLFKEGKITIDATTRSWVAVTDANREYAKQLLATQGISKEATNQEAESVKRIRELREQVYPAELAAKRESVAKMKEQMNLEIENIKIAADQQGMSSENVGRMIVATTKKWQNQIADYQKNLNARKAAVQLELARVVLTNEEALNEWSYARRLISADEYLAKKQKIELDYLDKEIAEIRRKIKEATTGDEKLVLEIELKVKKAEKAGVGQAQKREVKDLADAAATDEVELQNRLDQIHLAGIQKWDIDEQQATERRLAGRQAYEEQRRLISERGDLTDSEKIKLQKDIDARLKMMDEDQLQAKLQRQRDVKSQLLAIEEEGLEPWRMKERADIALAQFDLETASLVEGMRQRGATLEEMEDARLARSKARMKEEADWQRAMWQMNLEQAGEMAGNFATAFKDLYDASGQEVEAFFYLNKAAAIAQAAISTALAIMKAYETANPYVAAGLAAAAAAVGGVQIGIIAAQKPPKKKAAGGLITDGSGMRDDVPILAMRDEYVIRQAAVKKYGVGFMDAINSGLLEIPEKMYVGLSRRVGKVTHRYAEGGLVTPTADPNKESKRDDSVQIVNVIDPSLLEKYLTSVPGQKTLVNVLTANRYELRKMMA